MKTFHSVAMATVLAVSFAIGFTVPIAALAATSPSLGAADSYSILSGAGATNTGATTISGDVGVSPAASFTGTSTVTFLTAGNPHLADTSAANAQLANTAAFGALSAAPNVACDTTYTGTKDLAGLTLPPGIYCADAFTLSGTLTLDDTGGSSGVWIFRSAADLVTSSGGAAKVQFLNGTGLACNVWWKLVSSATIGTGATFIGNILASTAVTLQTGATLNGRAFAQTAAVTLDTNTIQGPTCTPPPPPVAPPAPVTLAPGIGTGSGRIVPLIGILKIPSPLALPAGAGSVTYSYTVWNVGGQQALDNVSVTDNACGPVAYISGDLNGSGKLDPSENWKYTCTTTLAKTTENTAVATGYSDDPYHQATIATAIATVAVGLPLTPPLINIVKVPSRLTPFPVGGGMVTYSYIVTNPGTVSMHDVVVTDNKCSPVTRVIGDSTANGNNNNGLLDPGESWAYTCRTNVPVSTSNTATAQGVANGFTARGYAFATVLVTAPALLPNTGFPPQETGTPWDIIIAAGSLTVLLVIYSVVRKKQIA